MFHLVYSVIEKAVLISKNSLCQTHIGLLVLLSFASPAYPEQPSTLRFVAFERPPFVIVENGKIVGGIDYQLALKLAENLGLKLETDVFPWPRCLQQLKTGEADIGSSVLWTRDRDEYLHFLQPPTPAPAVIHFYMRTGEENRIRYYEDNYNLRIGLRRFALYFPKFDNDPRVNRIFVNDDLQLPKMLLANRVDAFIGRASIMDLILEKEGYSEHIRKADYRYTAPALWYFVLSKQSAHAHRLEEFNQAFERTNSGG